MYVYRNLHCILLLLFILISIICGGKLTFGTLDDIKASLDKERDDFNPLKSPEFVKVNYYFLSSHHLLRSSIKLGTEPVISKPIAIKMGTGYELPIVCFINLLCLVIRNVIF